ncbi:MAG: hypothetical protein JO325_17915, partial [Solirubrobacterales bacterium]|nr:hypothetical protein [Solirubrobacterales bacterium]
GREPVVAEPDAVALAAVRAVDPREVRRIEFASGAEAAELYRAAAAREQAGT